MVAGAGEVDVVDLSAEDDAPEQRCPPPPAPPSAGPRRGRVPPGSRRVLAALAVAALVAGAGSWHQHRALAETRRTAAAARLAAAELQAVQEAARTAPQRRSALVRDATDAVSEVVGSSAASPSGAAAGPPLWWPADLGARAADAGGPLDLEVLGTWPSRGGGVQWVGFRLVTGLDDGVGRLPCGVPSVRLRAWASAGPAGVPRCRVMASGLRGTAVREGTTGEGAERGELQEVVLVSGGRAAAVAVWSDGGAPLPLDGPALGAAAAALLASAEPA